MYVTLITCSSTHIKGPYSDDNSEISYHHHLQWPPWSGEVPSDSARILEDRSARGRKLQVNAHAPRRRQCSRQWIGICARGNRSEMWWLRWNLGWILSQLWRRGGSPFPLQRQLMYQERENETHCFNRLKLESPTLKLWWKSPFYNTDSIIIVK